MSQTEFDQSQANSIKFTSETGLVKAGVEFLKVDLSQLRPEERGILEELYAGMVMSLNAALMDRDIYKQAGFDLPDTLRIILDNVRNASLTLGKIYLRGRSRME